MFNRAAFRIRILGILCLVAIAVLCILFRNSEKPTELHALYYVKKQTKIAQRKFNQCEPVGPFLNGFPRSKKFAIPLLMHQIYGSKAVPKPYIPLIKKCNEINAGLVHILWTDKVFDEFLEKKYPDLTHLLAQYRTRLHRSDFMRLIILYHFGGIYIDMDVECRKPFIGSIDKWDSSCIFDKELEFQTQFVHSRSLSLMNSVVICRPKHPFLKQLIDQLPTTLKLKYDPLSSTGPFFITDQYLKYQKQKNLAPEDRVTVAESSAFSPLPDKKLFPELDVKCNALPRNAKEMLRASCQLWMKKREQFKSFSEELLKDSICVHRFFHFGWRLGSLPYESHDICREVPDIKTFALSSHTKI